VACVPEDAGLNPGVVPDEQQAGALSALAEQDEAVDVSDENLGSLRQGEVAAAETLLERADTGEPIEEADADAFNSSFADLGIRCESARWPRRSASGGLTRQRGGATLAMPPCV